MLRSTGTNAWSRRSWAVSRSISLGQRRWLAQEKESRWSRSRLYRRGVGRQKQEQMEVEYLALGLTWRTSRNYRIKFKTYGKSKPKAHGLRPRAHPGANPKAQEPLKHQKQQEDPHLWTRDWWHTFGINRNQRLAQPPRCRCPRPKFMSSYQLWIYWRITYNYGRILPLTLTLAQRRWSIKSFSLRLSNFNGCRRLHRNKKSRRPLEWWQEARVVATRRQRIVVKVHVQEQGQLQRQLWEQKGLKYHNNIIKNHSRCSMRAPRRVPRSTVTLQPIWKAHTISTMWISKWLWTRSLASQYWNPDIEITIKANST